MSFFNYAIYYRTKYNLSRKIPCHFAIYYETAYNLGLETGKNQYRATIYCALHNQYNHSDTDFPLQLVIYTNTITPYLFFFLDFF